MVHGVEKTLDFAYIINTETNEIIEKPRINLFRHTLVIR